LVGGRRRPGRVYACDAPIAEEKKTTQLVTTFRHALMPWHLVVMELKYWTATLSWTAIWHAGIDQSEAMSLRLSQLPITAKQALQLTLSAHRWRQ